MENNKYKNKIYSAYQEYLKIKNKYGSNVHILIFPHTGTGDIWMIGRFLNKFLEKNKIDNYVLLVKGDAESNIASLLNINQIAVIEESIIKSLIEFSMYFSTSDNDIHILHHYVSTPQLCVTPNFEGYKHITFEDMFKIYTFGLGRNEKPTKFLIAKTNNKNNKILLNPYTSSVKDLPLSIWERIAAYLIYCGFDVYTNTNDNQKIINGTKKLFLKHYDLINFANECFMIISIRSGLCDIIADSDCIKIILMPNDWEVNWKNQLNKNLAYFGIKNNYHSKNTHEIQFSKNDVNSLHIRIRKILNNYISKDVNVYSDIKELSPNVRSSCKCITMTTDQKFFKYAFVTLASIIDNSSQSKFYDIILFVSYVAKDDLLVLRNFVSKYENVSVRFVDFKSVLKKYKFETQKEVFSPIVYARLLLPHILYRFEKVLYIDSDMLIKIDLFKLLDLDIENYAIAAVPDIGASTWRHDANCVEKKYLSSNLCLSISHVYINSGLLLFNVKKFNNNFSLNQIIKLATLKSDWHWYDQDVINVLCKNNMYYLDFRWNLIIFVYYINLKKANKYIRAYKIAKKNPYIIHFINSGFLKLNNTYTTEYYKIAKKIPYYTEILNEKNVIRNSNKRILIRLLSVLKKSRLLNIVFPPNSYFRNKIKKILK